MEFIPPYNKGIVPPEVVDHIKSATRQYARRQMVWFKKDKRIKWVTSYNEAEKLVKKFLAS